MNRRRLWTHACASGLFLFSAAPAVAQHLTLSPTIGVYIPVGEAVKAASGEEFKQEVAISVGGRLGFDFGPRFGVVTSIAYAPSNLRVSFSGDKMETDANLLLGAARATVYVIPTTSPVWLNLNGGVSLVKRSGEAYEDIEDNSAVGGVVGATVGFNLGGPLSFYVAAEDYIYGAYVVEPGVPEDGSTQHDVQLAVGFGVPLNR